MSSLPSSLLKLPKNSLEYAPGSRLLNLHVFVLSVQMHFVSCNTNYPNVTEALKYPDGLAVLGVFIEVTFYFKNPNSNIKNEILIYCPYTFSTEVEGRIC